MARRTGGYQYGATAESTKSIWNLETQSEKRGEENGTGWYHFIATISLLKFDETMLTSYLQARAATSYGMLAVVSLQSTFIERILGLSFPSAGQISKEAGLSDRFSSSKRIAVGTAIAGRPPAQIRTCGTTAYGSYLGC